MTNPRLLWLTGAVLMIFCAIGMIASATLIGLPLFGIASAFGARPEIAWKVVLYGAILWAPLGFGAGVAVSAVLIRGLQREGVPEADG